MSHLLRLIDAYAIATPDRRRARRDELETILSDPRTLLTELERLTADYPEPEVREAIHVIRAVIKRHWP